MYESVYNSVESSLKIINHLAFKERTSKMESHSCSICGKILASPQSLWNHKKRHLTDNSEAFLRKDETRKSKNQKIVALTDALINDSPEDGLRDVSDLEASYYNNPPKRTKADIVGYANDVSRRQRRNTDIIGDDDSERSDITGYREGGDYIDEDEKSDDSDSEEYTEDRINVKFLPKTVKELKERFNKLLREYDLESKYEHRNELVFLLDELLRREGIDRDEYKKLNNEIVSIAEKEEEEEEEEEEEDDLEKITVETIIQHDKKEVKELLKDFGENLDEEFTDTLLKIEELVDVFVEGSFIDDESVLDKIIHEVNKLDESKLPKSKLLRFRILLKDIERNRFRVKEILNRFKDGSDDSHTLSMLQREELLSEEQADKINEILREGKDLEKIANVIKSSKIGNGISFLPTKIKDLTDTLQTGLVELAKTGKNDLKQKIGAMLDELLRRRAITGERYNVIKEDNNIM